MRNPILVAIGLLFFLPYFAFSQINSGEVIYRVKPPEKMERFMDTTGMDNSLMKQTALKFYADIVRTAPYLRFSLKFNTNEAIFQRPRALPNDNGMNLNQTAIFAGVIGRYYSNAAKGYNLHQFHSYNEQWRVKQAFSHIKWQIHRDKKTIHGYRCIKATATINLDKVTTRKIIAWFCPDLPFSFGPIGLSGLPGLVLAVEYHHYWFYPVKIRLRQKSLRIDKPQKGKLVSFEEYDKEMVKRSPRERRYRQSLKAGE